MKRVPIGAAALLALVLTLVTVPAVDAAQVFSMSISVTGCDLDLAIDSDYTPAEAYVSVDGDSQGAGTGYSSSIDANGDFAGTLTFAESLMLSNNQAHVTLRLIDKTTLQVIDEEVADVTFDCTGVLPLVITKDVVNFPPGATDPYRYAIYHGPGCGSGYAGDFTLPAVGGAILLWARPLDSYCLEETESNGAANVAYSPSDTITMPAQGSGSITVTNTHDVGPDPAIGAAFLGCNVRVDGVNLQAGDLVRSYIFDGLDVSTTIVETVGGSGEVHEVYVYGTDFAMTDAAPFFVYVQVQRNGALVLEADAAGPAGCSDVSLVSATVTLANPPDPLAQPPLAQVRVGDCNGPAIADLAVWSTHTFGPLAVGPGTYCLVVTDPAGGSTTYGVQSGAVDDDGTLALDATVTWQAPTTSTSTTSTSTTEPSTSSTAPSTTSTTAASGAGGTGAAGTASGSLPVTGADVRTTLALALGLVGAGVLALVARRRLQAPRR